MKSKDLYNGRYTVYEDGTVHSNVTKRDIGNQSVGGYLKVALFDEQGRKHVKGIHQIVAESFIPNPDAKPHVNHINGCKTDNRVSNLEWCTPLENNRHAVETGLNNISESNHNRWSDPEFSVKARQSMRDAKRGMYKGETNPNFKFKLKYNGTDSTVKLLSKELGITESKLFRNIHNKIDGKPSILDDLGIELL